MQDTSYIKLVKVPCTQHSSGITKYCLLVVYTPLVTAICLQQQTVAPVVLWAPSALNFYNETWCWTLGRREQTACKSISLHAFQCETSAAACTEKHILYRGSGKRNISHVLCSAVWRRGRHTVNCRQSSKAGSCEICILTAKVHKSVKSLSAMQNDLLKLWMKWRREYLKGGRLLKEAGGRNHRRNHATALYGKFYV